ncbi:MAG: hypothetical protein N2746_01480 [Deltaproteobacteria bacterium]|nr:hypothetical protein [Deltaproteobacteria bacterium]
MEKIKDFIGIMIILQVTLFVGVAYSKEAAKKVRPAVPIDSGKAQKKDKKEIKPAGISIENVRLEEVSKIISETTNIYFKEYGEIVKEEVKPKDEFETEEAYRKRIEGVSREINNKKIHLIEGIYKRKKYYQLSEIPITLPQYNPEEQYFDIKLLTLPILDNVIYQPPEEQTSLRFVPSENGVDLYLRLIVPPEKGRELRGKDKFIKGDFLFTMYLSLKSQDDLTIYNVVAFSEVEVYVKEKGSLTSLYKQSLRINTPTFPKRD